MQQKPNAFTFKQTRRLRVFLCYAKCDKFHIQNLRQRLCAQNLDPWLDEEDLLPGMDWELEITKAVSNSDVILICLSCKAIAQAGYVHREIKFALDAADKHPEGTIFIIPIKLEECGVPTHLARWQWVNLFESQGFDRLMRALKRRAMDVGATLPLEEQTHLSGKGIPEWVKDQMSLRERKVSDRPETKSPTPANAEEYYRQGINHAWNRDHERAIADYSRAIQLDPNNAEYYYSRGISYNGMRNYPRAIEDKTLAIAIDPKNPQYYYSRGISYHWQGDLAAARRDYQRAADMGHVEAKAQLANL